MKGSRKKRKTHSLPLYYDVFHLLCKHLDIQSILRSRRVSKDWLACITRYIKENPIDLSWSFITNEGLKALAGVQIIDLRACKNITDEGLRHLAGVQAINLWGCNKITDGGLKHLAGVQIIDLRGCNKITDAGLKHLAGVKHVILWGCYLITDAGLKRLGDGVDIIK
jgi:hypothetical protein